MEIRTKGNERDEAISRGSPWQWLVTPPYQILDGVLKPNSIPAAVVKPRRRREPTRTYYPIAHPKLVSAIANLATGDDQAVLGFANEWGCLGHAEPGSVDHFRGADPLPWIWAQAETIRRLLKLIDLLANGPTSKLGDFLESIARPSRPVIEYDQLTTYEIVPDRYLEGLDEYHDPRAIYVHSPILGNPWSESPKSVQEIAEEIVTAIINNHLEKMRPILSNGRETGGGLERYWTFSNLLTAIYWHISNAATGTSQYRQCAECERFFKLEHGLRRYCPPDIGTVSLCSNKTRQTTWRNLHRKTRKEQSDERLDQTPE